MASFKGFTLSNQGTYASGFKSYAGKLIFAEWKSAKGNSSISKFVDCIRRYIPLAVLDGFIFMKIRFILKKMNWFDRNTSRSLGQREIRWELEPVGTDRWVLQLFQVLSNFHDEMRKQLVYFDYLNVFALPALSLCQRVWLIVVGRGSWVEVVGIKKIPLSKNINK